VSRLIDSANMVHIGRVKLAGLASTVEGEPNVPARGNEPQASPRLRGGALVKFSVGPAKGETLEKISVGLESHAAVD